MQQRTAHDVILTCNIELKALYKPRLTPVGLGKGANFHREVSHKGGLLQCGLHNSLEALCQQLPHSWVPVQFPVGGKNMNVDKQVTATRRGLNKSSDVSNSAVKLGSPGQASEELQIWLMSNWSTEQSGHGG